MTPLLAAFLTLAAAPGATLENSKVTDAASLQACFQIRPYEVIETQGTKSTKVFIDQDDIIGECITRAVTLAKASVAKRALVLELAKTVQRNSRAENSLRVYKVLIDAEHGGATCEDSAFYSMLIRGLSHPANFPSAEDSDLKVSTSMIELCESNKEFKTDIRDEVATGKAYVTDNVCAYLKVKDGAAAPAKCKETAQ